MSEEQKKIADRLRELLVEGARLPMTPEELSYDMKLFGEGLELDSVDVLQFVALIDNEFGVALTSDHREYFETIGTLSAYIADVLGKNR